MTCSAKLIPLDFVKNSVKMQSDWYAVTGGIQVRESQNKRKYGEDSVYYNKTAGCWVAQFNTVINGQPIRPSATGGSPEEAIKKLALKKREVLKQKQDLKSVYKTFGDELDKMMLALKGTVEDKSYSDYQYRQALLKTCPFSRRRLDVIDQAMIQQDLNQLVLERNLCESTCRKVIMFIKRVFRFAINNRDTGFNPVADNKCLKIPVAASEEKNVQPLSSKDCSILLQALDESALLKPIVYCMLYAGLRIAEVLALRWEDIDFTNTRIHIRKAVKRYENSAEQQKAGEPLFYHQLGPTKTKASMRTLPMSQDLKACLTEWKKRQKEWAPDGTGKHLVFPKQNGTLNDYDSFNKVFRCFLRQKGLEPRTYHTRVFRHTYASYLVKAKVDAKTLQALLGHTDITTTLQYYVATDTGAQKEAAGKIDMILGNMESFDFQLAV